MTDKTNKPAEIAEDKLDEISGGPHFRNFHGTSFDYQAMPELDSNLTSTTERGRDLNLGKYTGSAEIE